MPDPNPTEFYSTIQLATQQLQGFVQSVQALNTAISQIQGQSGGPNPARPGHWLSSEELEVEGEELALEQQQHSVARRNRYMRNPEFTKKVREWINASVDAKISQLKGLEITELNIGGQKLSQAEIAQKAGEKTDLGEQINDIILQKFERDIKAQPNRISSILDAIESSGLRQLRFGQLPPQQILRAAGSLAQQYSNYRAGEAIAAGKAPGRFTSMLGSLGGGLSLMGKAVGAASVISDVARNIYDTGIGDYRALTASGQLTGQGTMAGLAAKYTDPLKIWNPFGRLSFGQAQEIVQSTREQGFTGPMAGQVEQGLAHVVSNLGIQIGQATEFMTQSMREGGMSVGQVTQEMNKFHDATYNLNMNINDYTQQIMESTQQLRDMGAGQAAPGLAQTITSALPRAYRTPEGTGFLTGAFEKSRGVLAAMVGHGANVLNITSQRYARAGWSAMDTLLEREVQRARDQGYTDPNDIANYLSQTSPFFGGTNVNMLQQYIQRVQHGRGLTAQITMSHVANTFNRRMAEAQRKVVRYGQLTESDIKAKNLIPLYGFRDAAGKLHTSTTDTTGMSLIGYRNANTGEFHRLGQDTVTTGGYYTGSGTNRVLHSGPGGSDSGTFSIKKEQEAKRALIASARRHHLLSRQDIAQLEKAKPEDVSGLITQMMQRQEGRKVNVGTQVGTITVELGKQAQGLLTLVKERQNAVANSSIRNNQTNR